MALRDSATNAVTYLHGDHLGSVSVTTNASGPANVQEYDPWGSVRAGGITQTNLNYTGQRLDGTDLLYYHARMYDPVLARFVSADSVVPGSASGSMDGVQLRPLTVDFHEPGFVGTLNTESVQPFWFQLRDADKQQAGSPWGPQEAQALNRYSYVQNAPVTYSDPSGHSVYMDGDEAMSYADELDQAAAMLHKAKSITDYSIKGGAILTALLAVLKAIPMLGGIILGLGLTADALTVPLEEMANQLEIYARLIRTASNYGKNAIIISADCANKSISCYVTVINRDTGNGSVMKMGLILGGVLFDGWHNGQELRFDMHNSIWRPGVACTSSGGNPSSGNYYSGDKALCKPPTGFYGR
ncbi:MAG: RHS repeat-associated core domain-containing protein [Kouleothrix sp.]|nr:RHS repeat-associated core domain-containing protein [Kouleothrix sp.]